MTVPSSQFFFVRVPRKSRRETGGILRVFLKGSHIYHHASFSPILSILTSLSTSKSIPIMDRNPNDEQILAYHHRTKVQGKHYEQHTNRF